MFDGEVQEVQPDGPDPARDAAEASDETLPASSASIPTEALASKPLSSPWRPMVPWIITACIAAVVGGGGVAEGGLGYVLGAFGALLAGAIGASILVNRRRRVRLQRDRIVLEGLTGTTEVRFADITTIKAAGLLSSTSRPLSPERLSYASPTGTISFAELDPEGAAVVSRAVLQHAGPRLVQQFVDAVGAGGVVAFGKKLRATRAGLESDGLLLSWDEIERVDTTPTGVRVFGVDRPDRVILLPTHTENVVLLEAFVRRMQTAPPTARGVVDVVGWARTHPVGGALVCGVDRTEPRVGITLMLASAMGFVGAVLSGDEGLQIAGGFLALCALGFSTIGTMMVRRRAFAVYEHGVEKRGGFVAYDDVEHLQRSITDRYANGRYIERSVSIVLVDRHGNKTRFHGSGERSEAIAAAVVRRLLPKLAARAGRIVDAGGSVKSAHVVVDSAGVRTKKIALAWGEIAAAVVEGGALHLWKKGHDKSVIALSLDQRDALVVMEVIGERLARAKSAAGGEAVRDLFAVPAAENVDALIAEGVEVDR